MLNQHSQHFGRLLLLGSGPKSVNFATRFGQRIQIQRVWVTMEPPKATVIVPLYIWPTSSSLWEPLFQAYVFLISKTWLSSHFS